MNKTTELITELDTETINKIKQIEKERKYNNEIRLLNRKKEDVNICNYIYKNILDSLRENYISANKIIPMPKLEYMNDFHLYTCSESFDKIHNDLGIRIYSPYANREWYDTGKDRLSSYDFIRIEYDLKKDNYINVSKNKKI